MKRRQRETKRGGNDEWKRGEAGKMERKGRENKYSCCQYWEGRKSGGCLDATQKNFSSSASSVSLSNALVHAFLTSCRGKTLGSVQVSPTCPHSLHSSSATVLPHARGRLLTHRIKSHLRHLGTLQQAA